MNKKRTPEEINLQIAITNLISRIVWLVVVILKLTK